jgi:hypothetical protein
VYERGRDMFNAIPEKAPTTLRSETSAEHTMIPGSEAYSFCESTTAVSNHWHIRKLDETGKHSGGGITTASLCGMVKPIPEGMGGWDVTVDITPHHVAHNCQQCGELFRAEMKTFDSSDFDWDAISDAIGDE